MYRHAVPFTEILKNEDFIKSLETSHYLSKSRENVVHVVASDEKLRLCNKSGNNDYAELSNMKMIIDNDINSFGDYARNNLDYDWRQTTKCNPYEESVTEYQHTMEMKLEEDNLHYSLQQEGFIVPTRQKSSESKETFRSDSPSAPCWPLLLPYSPQSHEADARSSNLQSSLLPDYQALRVSTMKRAPKNGDIHNYESESSCFSDITPSDVDREHSISPISFYARPVKGELISNGFCSTEFCYLEQSPERNLDEKEPIIKESSVISPMNEDFKVQLLRTPTPSNRNEHELSDIGFSKETSVPMEFTQTPPRQVLRRIPAKVFRQKNSQNGECNESVCALNYSTISEDSFDITNDQFCLDSENLRTPKADGRISAFDSTPMQRRLSDDDFMQNDDDLNETIFASQTPTTAGDPKTPCTSTVRRRKKRKSLIIRKKHRLEPVPTIKISKDYFDQVYDLNVSEEALIKATGSSLSVEGISDANAARQIYLKNTTLSKSGRNNYINFGLDYRIQTLYRSSYPPRYALLNELFICRTCFQYFAVENALLRHQEKCLMRRTPPGNEIYRDKENFLSVFSVRGDREPIYCSNISLLTMFWLRDKVVYLDVEPFTYYVVARPDAEGRFLPLGYFSKQRENGENHNLCCFCVFPCFQKQGLGRFIIDFSYALSRLENTPGGPERPFSTLGEVAYRSYWYETMIQMCADILQNKTDNKISTIVKRTGMQVSDVIDTLVEMFPDLKPKNKRTLNLPGDQSSICAVAEELSLKRSKFSIRDEYFSPTFLSSLSTL